MKRILAILILLLATASTALAGGGCDVTIPYGTAATIDFNLFNTTGTALKTDAAYASGDVKIMKDEGAEANVTTGFTDEGQGYSQPLSATEAEARRIVLYIVDQTSPVWLDRVCTITTYGSKATAGAAGTITLDTGESATDDIYNDTTAIEIIEGTGKGQSRCITDYVGSTKVASVTPNWTTNPASGSIYVLKSQPYCGGLKTGGIGASTFASGAIDSDAIAASAIGASEIATDAIGAAELAADAVTEIGVDTNAQVVDGLNVDTYGELTSCPTATASFKTMLQFLYMKARNTLTEGSGTQSLKRDDTSTNLCTFSTSDNGTTYTRGEGS